MTIKISSATYGIPGHLIDVTDRVRLMVGAFNRHIVISNETMGGDPAVGSVKQLRVHYVDSAGQPQEAEGREGSTVLLNDGAQGGLNMPQWRA